MVRELQKKLHSSNKFSLKIDDRKTADFIDECQERLKEQRWVDKTGFRDGENAYSYIFQIIEKGLLWWDTTYSIDYRDYPGEVFTAAFSRPGAQSQTSAGTQKMANQLKGKIENCEGIFLLMDAEDWFNGQKSFRMNQIYILEELFKFINENNPSLKLALLFNKMELLPKNSEQTLQQIFRNDYPNAYSLRPKNTKDFFIYPLGGIKITEKGKVIPPETIRPQNIFDPIRWILELEF